MKTKVARQPGSFLAAMLVILVLLIIFMGWSWNLRRKEGFSGSPYGTSGFNRTTNWQSGGNNPQWYLGGMHSGAGGTVDTAWTDNHNILRAAPFNPSLRGAVYGGQHPAGPTSVGKEGLSSTNPTSNPTYYQAASGAYATDPAVMAYLSGASTGYSGSCSGLWDPTAVSEAQALAQTGSLEHDDFGEASLQTAINAAYDVNPVPPVTGGNGAALNDAQLAAMAY